MRANIFIILLTLWCVVSGALLGIGIDISNDIMRNIGGISMIIVVITILLKTEKSIQKDNTLE